MKSRRITKLEDLKETEIVLKVCLRRYDQERIFKDLQEIDELIKNLTAKRSDIIENRQNVSTVKITELKIQLGENRLKQELIVDTNGLLKKLAKAIKVIKETKEIEEV